MDINKIKSLIKEGEGQKIEFKKAEFAFPKDAWETVCAFLNTDGDLFTFEFKHELFKKKKKKSDQVSD
ncbi:MAG: hypothetical protein Q4F80_07205, partial [bacterium]|nr:hypothetical protein [bacterium]